MNTSRCQHWALAAALAGLSLLPLRAADLIANGGFESGFANWTRVDQIGSEGTFFAQSGTTSPVLGLTVSAPPYGSFAAMTDAEGPGSHVLYQDFFVASASAFSLGFSVFINNDNDEFAPNPDFHTPGTLDFSGVQNQRARVDLMTTTADPFSLSGGDILLNLFETAPGDPLVSGYTAMQFDVTTLLTSYEGQTLRLRFAAVDNVAPMNFGVDDVHLQARTSAVPDGLPASALWIALTAVAALHAGFRRRPATSRGPC